MVYIKQDLYSTLGSTALNCSRMQARSAGTSHRRSWQSWPTSIEKDCMGCNRRPPGAKLILAQSIQHSQLADADTSSRSHRHVVTTRGRNQVSQCRMSNITVAYVERMSDASNAALSSTWKLGTSFHLPSNVGFLSACRQRHPRGRRLAMTRNPHAVQANGCGVKKGAGCFPESAVTMVDASTGKDSWVSRAS